MMSLRLFLFVGICMFWNTSSSAQKWSIEDIVIYEQFSALEKTLDLAEDSIHVINFWATWCKPCVAEIPFFEETYDQLKSEKIKFTLVSLDFGRQIEKKVLPYLNDQKITSEVVVLTDGKFNDWIDRVDPSWSGAIPITLIKKGDIHMFYEMEFHSTEELMEKIKPLL